MPRTEEALRRAGSVVALAAAAALACMLLPVPAAVERRYAVLVLALLVALQVGCAAVLLSLARRAVAQLARRALEAAREISAAPWRAATELRWAGFTATVFCVAYVVGDVRSEPPAEKDASEDGWLLFLVFLVGVLTVNLSMITGRDSEPPPAVEERHDGGEVNVMIPASVRVDCSKVLKTKDSCPCS